MSKWKKQCPKCSEDIFYKSEKYLKSSILKNQTCRHCSVTSQARYKYNWEDINKNIRVSNKKIIRNCPKCKLEILYKNFGRAQYCERDGDLCKRCKIRKVRSDKKYFGELFSAICSNCNRERKLKNKTKSNICRSCSTSLKILKKPNFNNTGKSGFYKDWFFRSFLELKFVLDLESKNINWKTAEHIMIPYEFEGKIHNYHPDFIIGNNIIECKPEYKLNDSRVIAKKVGAEIWCLENGYKYTFASPLFNRHKFKNELNVLIKSGLVEMSK